jgi:hypothetical protein
LIEYFKTTSLDEAAMEGGKQAALFPSIEGFEVTKFYDGWLD